METANATESVEKNPFTQERLATQFIQLIDKQKLQYKDIAEKLGFHYTYISYIQNPRYYDKVPHHVWEKIRNYLNLIEPTDLKSDAVLAGTVLAGSDYDIDKEKDTLKKTEQDDRGVDVNINLTIIVGRKKIRCTRTFRV